MTKTLRSAFLLSMKNKGNGRFLKLLTTHIKSLYGVYRPTVVELFYVALK